MILFILNNIYLFYILLKFKMTTERLFNLPKRKNKKLGIQSVSIYYNNINIIDQNLFKFNITNNHI